MISCKFLVAALLTLPFVGAFAADEEKPTWDVNVVKDVFQTDKVDMVLLNGRLYDAVTLNEQVTGNRKTQPFYWQ